ncbi:TPA_asm: polyprotein [Triticum virus 1]|uniref:RNA-directed RNA polymerase n=1 Tax=Triticum virus 1 TaxID=2977997 RepID=A0A9N6YJ48_9RHAB|nr:TPA_asm: polyprotein [Triticum virus 1]
MEIDEEIGEFGILDEKSMTDLHLANAINLDHVEFLVHGKFALYPIFIANYQKNCWNSICNLVGYRKDVVIGLLAPTQRMLLEEFRSARINQSLYKDLVRIVGRALAGRKADFPLTKHYKEICEYNVMCNENYMYCFRFLTQLVCMVSEASREGRKSFYPGMRIVDGCVVGNYKYNKIDWDIYSNDSFCMLIDNPTNKCYAGSFDSLLLIMDTLGQRICMDIGNQICILSSVPGMCDRQILDNIIEIGDRVLDCYGNDGYDFIGLFEAMVVSALLKKNPDKITDSEEFYTSCKEEVQEMVKEGKFDDRIIFIFEQLVSCLMELENEMLSNIFCLYRIWGHPRVNIYDGMKKVYTKGMADKPAPVVMSKIILCQFRKMFLVEFFSVNHTYPMCIFSNQGSSYVVDCIKSDIPIAYDNPRYTIWEFLEVDICQLWEMEETYDVYHILNDKAVSPNRSELYESILSGKGTVMGVQRRGIVRWLMGNSIRCKEFLSKVDKEGLDRDSMIIGMYEKEREIKIKARMFSLMSEEMRMYFVLTEELISNRILKYFPEITMKDPLHIQVKKLWSASGYSHINSLDPTINIDFEKWNLNMRDELTNPLFRQMDRMFGYSNLIARTHEIFEESYIYSSSGKYLPEAREDQLISNPPMSYMGHKGGFEGLRQKGWTIATICLISYITDNQRVKALLLGQGDNQVVRIQMPHIHWMNIRLGEVERVLEARRILDNFIINMESYFSEAGLPIKTRETWKSTRLFMYGKVMFMDSNALSQWMKKLLRSYALSNEGTLTISGVIGTIATNLCAAAHASSKPDILYVVFLILGEWSLEYLFAYHPFTRKSISEGSKLPTQIPENGRWRSIESRNVRLDRLMATILMVPTAVGGSITIPLTGFIIRGFPDNASEGYSWLKLLYEGSKKYGKMWASWYSFLANDTIEYDMLVQSPWSLNHKKPPTPGLHSREMVRDWLLSGRFSDNNVISNMSEAMDSFDRKRICEQMIGERVNPLILNEIYSSFPQVYLDTILRRIENTRTIRKLAMKMPMKSPIVSKLMIAEHEFLGYLYWRGFQQGLMYSSCATSQCRQARNEGWKKQIKGLTTPHPLEFIFDKVCHVSENQCDGSDYIYCRICREGDFPPYLGSKVKTKVVSLQDIALRSEPLVATASKLLRYASWLNLGPNSMELLNANISVVCDISLFDNLSEKDSTFYSGCVEHRFNPACASEGCFINYAPQIGKTVFMSSDHLPKFGRGTTNFTLHFQALYGFIQYNSAYAQNTQFQHYHLCCEECIVPVDDEIDDIGNFEREIKILYSPSSVSLLRKTLGFLDKKPLVLNERIINNVTRFLTISLDKMNLSSLRIGVHRILAVQSAMMIMYTRHDAPINLGSDDLQTFPRVYGYKISTAMILDVVAEYLFVIKFCRSQIIPSARGIKEILTKLYYQLTKIPLERFKGIGSLCLGRTWSPDNNEVSPYLNLGEFPEDPTSFLRAIKAEVINRVRNLQIQESKYRHCQIPSVTLSIKEETYISIHQVLFSEHCTSCIDILWIAYRDKVAPQNCPHSHISRACKRVKIVPLTIDSAIKYMKVYSPSIDPPLITEKFLFDKQTLVCFDHTDTFDLDEIDTEELQDCVERIKRNYRVLLPTCALYKWDSILSHIQDDDYQHILVFGDGTGQTSLVCSRRFVSATIYPTALLARNKFIPQDLMSTRPYISRIYSNVSNSLLENVCDDITDPLWYEHIIRFLVSLNGNVLIISDLEDKGGNWKLVDHLCQLRMGLDGEFHFDFLHKVYFHERDDFPNNAYSYVLPHCNAHYFEGFISNLEFPSFKASLEGAYSVEWWRALADNMQLYQMIRFKEEIYTEAVRASETIAWSVCNRDYLALDKEFVKQHRGVILYKHLKYISDNFKAPYEDRKSDDHRILLDGILIEIIKGIKILLCILYGPDILSSPEIRSLGLVKARPKYRVHNLPELHACLVLGDEEYKLSKKEIRAGVLLRQIFLLSTQYDGPTELPDTIQMLYNNEISVGAYLFKRYGRMFNP